jgi:hypothetical protein
MGLSERWDRTEADQRSQGCETDESETTNFSCWPNHPAVRRLLQEWQSHGPSGRSLDEGRRLQEAEDYDETEEKVRDTTGKSTVRHSRPTQLESRTIGDRTFSRRDP